MRARVYEIEFETGAVWVGISRDNQDILVDRLLKGYLSSRLTKLAQQTPFCLSVLYKPTKQAQRLKTARIRDNQAKGLQSLNRPSKKPVRRQGVRPLKEFLLCSICQLTSPRAFHYLNSYSGYRDPRCKFCCRWYSILYHYNHLLYNEIKPIIRQLRLEALDE